MKFSREKKREILRNAPVNARKCVSYTLEKIDKEYDRNGKFLSIQDFITRMLNANLDIHAFTVIEKYVPMRFPNGGEAAMLRTMLAFMGYDPDYSVLPDIEVYPGWYDEDDDELPFN
ncbi:MAG: hypothetical protein IKL06_03980 [Lachnospiraceae bacterium]|nr:hypothetical protein [Lachnospiraceae bacterium]